MESVGSLDSIYEFVPKVSIDVDRFKYVIITFFRKPLKGKSKKNRKPELYFIRGNQHCEYHFHVVEVFMCELKVVEANPQLQHLLRSLYPDYKGDLSFSSLFDIECEGGGRIMHDVSKQCISIYGYSQGFGKADHFLSAQLIKSVYTSYPESSITWSDEGY